MHLCGGVLPCHACRAREAPALREAGLGQGRTDPSAALLWADPIHGHGPGHFECPRTHPWRGRKDSGEGARRTGPLFCVLVDGDGLSF